MLTARGWLLDRDVAKTPGDHDLYAKWLVGAFCNPGFLRFGENFRFGPGLSSEMF